MKFEQGNTQGKGRPKGAKNRLNKDTLHALLQRITEDFEANYDQLTTNHKIKLLTAFKMAYVTEAETDKEPPVFHIEFVNPSTPKE